jgi:hypothetical protein
LVVDVIPLLIVAGVRAQFRRRKTMIDGSNVKTPIRKTLRAANDPRHAHRADGRGGPA